MVDLKKVRESKEMTQMELAEHVGVARQTITEYEAGRITPSPTVAKKIGEVLGISWTDFFED